MATSSRKGDFQVAPGLETAAPWCASHTLQQCRWTRHAAHPKVLGHVSPGQRSPHCGPRFHGEPGFERTYARRMPTEIRRRGLFGQVSCAFWKEEPSLRDARILFDPETIQEVYVVPNFISEGYFTETVIPRELELEGTVTRRLDGQVWKYCAPVGSNPAMTEMLLRRARAVAPDVSPSETSLLIVAHGTDLNENSAVAAKREAEAIARLGRVRCGLEHLHGRGTAHL